MTEADDLTAPHPAFEPALIGQVIEWLVWSEVVARSRGDLRVFLPMRDMGIDGVVLCHSTEAMVPVQVKGRSRLEDGILRVHVQEGDVRDPRAVVVVAVVDLEQARLLEPLFVMTSVELRERARLIEWGPRRAYAVTIPYPPGTVTHWAALACSLDEMPQRIVPGTTLRAWAGMEPAVEPVSPVEERENTGYIGEMALVRMASMSPHLNVFHAAPDTGFVEYIVRNVATDQLRGYQVKCVDLAAPHRQVHVTMSTASRAADNRLLVFLRTPHGDIESPALLIPAPELEDVTTVGDGRLLLRISPGKLGELERYAVGLDDLPGRLED